MPRRPRRTAGGEVYHVLNRDAGRVTLFHAGGHYAAFERVLAEAAARFPGVGLLTYCVMPNHWHLVLWPRADGELSAFMNWLTLTQRYHHAHHLVGHGAIYQGRFKSFPVQVAGDVDLHFLALCRYVERNALRAGLVPRAEDWRWSGLWRRARGGGRARPTCWRLGRWARRPAGSTG